MIERDLAQRFLDSTEGKPIEQRLVHLETLLAVIMSRLTVELRPAIRERAATEFMTAVTDAAHVRVLELLRNWKDDR